VSPCAAGSPREFPLARECCTHGRYALPAGFCERADAGRRPRIRHGTYGGISNYCDVRTNPVARFGRQRKSVPLTCARDSNAAHSRASGNSRGLHAAQASTPDRPALQGGPLRALRTPARRSGMCAIQFRGTRCCIHEGAEAVLVLGDVSESAEARTLHRRWRGRFAALLWRSPETSTASAPRAGISSIREPVVPDRSYQRAPRAKGGGSSWARPDCAAGITRSSAISGR
jgi:hypothetical protein